MSVQPKSIIHIDMDAFYASVEVLDNPALKGKPVIVGGSMLRGVVSAASYEARKFGIHSAQPIKTAMRLCPQGVFLPVRMSRYKEISKKIFDIFYSFTSQVEALSIDEAFLDVTGSIRLFGSPAKIAQKIKQEIRLKTELTASAGIGPSKFIAKIASDLHKPDGLTVVPYDKTNTFLEPLAIEKLWGVGSATRKKLKLLGVTTIGDLRRLPPELLKKHFGKHGVKLHMLSQGIDEREVMPVSEIKSIGHEETFEEDIYSIVAAKREILALTNKVVRRLRKNKTQGRTITLKVKYDNFVQVTRSLTLSRYCDDAGLIYNSCCGLVKKTEVGKRPVRLIGITVSSLCFKNVGNQLGLFTDSDVLHKKQNLNKALDTIYARYGEGAIIPGTLLEK